MTRWALVGVLAAACQPDPSMMMPDDDAGPGGRRDAGMIVLSDIDGDGLCDDTEVVWGTDPMVADSDGDGLNDRAERDFGYRPRDPGSPQREILVFTSENAISTTSFSVTRVVTGDGETFTGAFEGLPVADPDGLTAADFVTFAEAIGAQPEENVFEVHQPEQEFVGVFGRTQLVFELRFGYPEAVSERGCIRGYPFRYSIKRQDGALFGLTPYLLLVLPRGQRLDTAEWCPTTCI